MWFKNYLGYFYHSKTERKFSAHSTSRFANVGLLVSKKISETSLFPRAPSLFEPSQLLLFLSFFPVTYSFSLITLCMLNATLLLQVMVVILAKDRGCSHMTSATKGVRGGLENADFFWLRWVGGSCNI